MKRTFFLFTLLAGFCFSLYALENIPDFSQNSIPVLNQELASLDRRIRHIETRISERAVQTLTISGGIVTATQFIHAIETEAAGASDDLNTINGGSEGNILIVHAANSTRTVVLKDATGNLQLAGDCTLDNSQDTAVLVKIGTNWQAIACSGNGA